MNRLTINDIRNIFVEKYKNGEFVVNKAGIKTVEIIDANFEVDKKDTAIFGELNEYANRELEWYKSQSLNVNDIPGKVPIIWKRVADNNGYINSNYGWCIWNEDNYNQYKKCLKHLISDENTRQGCMIYNRPSMQDDYNKNGMSDFMCTFAVQVLIRDNVLYYNVLMRSNDAIYGFKNDLFWHKFVINELLKDLELANVRINDYKILWHAGSLHLYESGFKFIEEIINN